MTTVVGGTDHPFGVEGSGSEIQESANWFPLEWNVSMLQFDGQGLLVGRFGKATAKHPVDLHGRSDDGVGFRILGFHNCPR